MEPQTERAGIEEKPIAQGTGDHAIVVYPDRVELVDGFQDQSAFSVGFEEIAAVSIKGFINCTLIVEVNNGRRLNIEGMALPDAWQVKAAIEHQKKAAAFLSGPDSSSQT